MAALIGHFQPVILRKLLPGLDFERNPVSARVEFAGGALVERECSVDEVAAVAREPIGAVECAGSLFTAGQRHLDGAFRPVVLGPVADERVHPDRGLGLVVARAARVEGAILFDQCERIASPILSLRFHHIDVREQQDRLELGIAPGIDGNEAPFLRVIGRRK